MGRLLFWCQILAVYLALTAIKTLSDQRAISFVGSVGTLFAPEIALHNWLRFGLDKLLLVACLVVTPIETGAVVGFCGFLAWLCRELRTLPGTDQDHRWRVVFPATLFGIFSVKFLLMFAICFLLVQFSSANPDWSDGRWTPWSVEWITQTTLYILLLPEVTVLHLLSLAPCPFAGDSTRGLLYTLGSTIGSGMIVFLCLLFSSVQATLLVAGMPWLATQARQRRNAQPG